MKLDQYAKTYLELQHKLNDVFYAGDLNKEYETFWELYKQELNDTATFLSSSKTRMVSLHDTYVRNFSAKQCEDGYRTFFQVNAFVYVDGREIGRQQYEIGVLTKHKLREISGKVILDFVLDNRAGELLVIYLDHNGNHKYVIVPFTVVRTKQVDDFKEYA